MIYEKLFSEKKPILILSKGEYSNIEFKDGTKCFAPYTHKELSRRFGIELKTVRRGVYADPKESVITENGIKIMNKEFKFSRRIAKAWACILLAILPLFSFCQNIAPVAVNDTVGLCKEEIDYFIVILNDADANGDRLKLNTFTEPTSGNLVSASNTGMFRYEWDSLYRPNHPKPADITWHKNHSAMVVPMAVQAHLIEGKDIAEFIRSHSDPFDFMLRVKAPKTARLMWGDTQIQNTTRYYISTDGHQLTKVMAPLARSKNPERERPMKVHDGYKATPMNKIAPVKNINHGWYIEEAEKLIRPLYDGVLSDLMA